MAKKRHRTAYQKANADLEAEGRRQCFLLYSATAIALFRHWGKRKAAILSLFEITGDVWHSCAETNLHSMIEMCYQETGIEVQNGDGKTWEDLLYLNGKFPDKPMTNAQWVYMRQQQKKWIAPQVMACIMVALHRKYGFGFDRLSRIYSQIQDIEAEFARSPERIQKAARELTGINIYDIVTQPHREEAQVV
jgi:hypothetical protein